MDRPIPELPGVEHRFVQAGTLRVHVAEAGSGPPLVLQHGWPQHWLTWRKLIPALAEDYRVICPDMRGLGWTDAPPDGYEKESLATDLLNVLDALELERVRVVGHDWGGFASFLAVLRAPERFERFACLGITTPWLKASRNPMAFIRTIYQPLIASPVLGRRIAQSGFVKLLLDRGSVAPDAWTRDVRDSYVDQFKEGARAEATVQIYRTFLKELRPILKGRYAQARLTVPTLLMYGEHDPVINEERLGPWREHADRMEVVEVPDVGHFLPDEAPGFVLDRLVPFLR